MIASLLAIAIAIVILLATALFPTSLRRLESPVAVLGGAAAVLAAAVGSAWYFVERPEAAKLKIEHATSSYVIRVPDKKSPPRALLLMEVSVTNVGKAAFSLQDEDYHVLLQRVTPVPVPVASTLLDKTSRGVLSIQQSDTWDQGLMAEFSREEVSSQGKVSSALTGVIEAGETENLYFRAAVPCSPGLRLYLQSRFEKKPAPSPLDFFRKKTASRAANTGTTEHDKEDANKLFFYKQSIVDLKDTCGRKP